MRCQRSCRTVGFGILAVLALLPQTAGAQYFGQNKVQYEDFDFEVMRTEHFDIYHYREERAAVDQAARLAEQWYSRLSRLLNHELRGRQPLILYASHPHFQQTNVVSGFIGEGTGGVTEALRRRMVLPFSGSFAETSHVLGHEMVHAFQFDLGGRNALRLPLWFIEGMAEYLSIGPAHAHTMVWLRDAAIREALPGFENLNHPDYFPYRFGHAAWAYLGGRFGDDVVPSIYDAAARTGDAIGAIEAVTGIPIEALNEDWHRAIHRAANLPGAAPSAPSVIQTLLSKDVNDGGRINLAPALSPDGRWMTFLSERDVFSIDLFLADATTGRVVRKLTETATDPHLESLQFLNSAGAWDAMSRRIAFAAVSRGQPTLAIIDVAGEERTREIVLPTLGEVFNPSWSPDGRSIVFAAIAGGIPDLYVYELANGQLRQLTDDLYTDLQPSWSPSGDSVAFVTDRFSTRLTALDFGEYQLALLDVSTGRVRPVHSSSAGKHINPQWSADGRWLYFIGEPDGIPNVYRVDLSGQRIERITRVSTGVTGITALSPAMSYASGANRLAFSLFEDGNYAIQTLEQPSALGLADVPDRSAAVLPPREQPGGIVEEALRQAQAPPATAYPVSDYKSGLSLEFVGAGAAVSPSLGRYGTFVNGGISLLFSDMLNNHTLATTAQINGGVRDFAGQIAYLNKDSRWGWGGLVQQIPYLTGRFAQRLDVVDGRQVIVEDELLFRETDQELTAFAQYPLSRAQRLEIGGGLRRIGFSQELTTRVFSFANGQLLQEERSDLEAPGPVNLAESSAALVHDTSVFGATSPVAGQRSRIEVAPTFGTLRFTQALVDYRRYQSVGRPFTLALRGLHYGRYGGNSEDARLSPLFLGYPTLVRGYDIGSFEFSECVPDGTSTCPAVDRLLGSRLLVANAELRFPLFGAFTGEYRYGPIPIEAFLFADSGVAWSTGIRPSFAGGSRDLVTSTGAGIRVNALGYLILEINATRPLDRPGRGWLFGFQLTPGF